MTSRAGLLVLGLVLGLAVSARAEQVTVLSGEHAGFSRLVLVLDRPSAWTRSDGARSVSLRLARPDIVVDPAGVFRLIPRTRLADVTAMEPGPGLLLTLACDCPVTVFEDRPGVLVIDVADPPPTDAPADPPADPLADPPSGPPVADAGAGAEPAPLAAAELDALFWRNLPVQPGRRSTPLAESPVVAETLSDMAMPAVVPTSDLPPGTATVDMPDPEPGLTDAARAILAEQIGRAAADGLVRATPVAPRAAARPDGVAADLPGLRVTSGTDLGLGASAAPGISVSGGRCLADQDVDVAAWGNPHDPWGEIGRQRAAVLGEFDRVDPVAVRTLARSLIHYGFGQEALMTLTAFGEDAGPETPLGALARIVDDVAAPGATALMRMTDCEGLAALWAVLSNPALTGEEVVTEAAVLRAFSGLPLHLRRHLGPPLAERLSAVGLAELARGILDAIRRAPGSPGAAVALAEARMALAAGAPEAAAQLGTIASGTGGTADDARLLLAETLIDRGGAPDPGLVADLEALLHERGDATEAARILRLVVLGHAALGDFDAAFAALPPEGAEALAAEALLRLARDAPDATFLIRAFSRTDWDGGMAPTPVRLALADRFLALGLPGVAEAALSADPTLPEERLRLARVRLAQDRPAETLRLVAELPGTEPADLRGTALALLGDPAGATAALALAGAVDALARLAWRDGDWDRVRDTGLDAERRAAERILGREGAPRGASGDEQSATLSAARSLLAETGALRTDLAELLAAHSPAE